MVKTAHVLSVKMPLSSKVNCSIFSSVTIVCLEEAFLMKLSPLSQKRCKTSTNYSIALTMKDLCLYLFSSYSTLQTLAHWPNKRTTNKLDQLQIFCDIIIAEIASYIFDPSIQTNLW